MTPGLIPMAMHRSAARRLVGASLACVLVVTNGCYAYRPVQDPGTLPAGETVRLHITMRGAASLASELGPRVELVEGRIAATPADASHVAVHVQEVRTTDGGGTTWAGDLPLRVPLDAIGRLERREFSRGRTIAAAGVAGAALVGVAVAAFAGDRGGTDGTGGERPPPP